MLRLLWLAVVLGSAGGKSERLLSEIALFCQEVVHSPGNIPPLRHEIVSSAHSPTLVAGQLAYHLSSAMLMLNIGG